MGKFQSKHASKGRQSPEGGSLASSVVTCHRLENIYRHKSKMTENLCVEIRENGSDHNCNHNVIVPPKKTPDTDKSTYIQANKHTEKKKKHAAGTECCMVPEEDFRQEWVFTLYNFDNSGKVTKEDMSRLIHSIYEVLEASMKQPYAGLKALKVKLEVTATACTDKISQTSTEKEQSTSQKVGSQARNLYCVEENIERRNHYLDLAGIENYNSKFDNTEPPSQEPRQLPYSAFQHHTVVATKNCMPPENSTLHSLSSKSTSVRNDKSKRDRKTCKHPASWCHLTNSHPPAHSVLQSSHSKRLRSRVQDATSHIKPTPREDREVFSGLQLSCTVPLIQRHKHHHHHEHHHHHHYHPS